MKKSNIDKEFENLINSLKKDLNEFKDDDDQKAINLTISSLEKIMKLDEIKKKIILEGIKRPQLLDMERLYVQGLNNMLLSNLVSPEIYIKKIDRSDPAKYWKMVEKVFKDFKDLGIIKDKVEDFLEEKGLV